MTDIGFADDTIIVKKEELQRKIGQRVIKLREAKDWSQADLARACKKERQAIEKIENGKVNPTSYSLYEVAKAMGVHIRDLFDFKM